MSQDGRVGTISFEFDVPSVPDVKPATQDDLIAMLHKHAQSSGMQIEVNGQGMQQMPETGGSAELIGMAVAAVVLIITFGSLIAAGLPLVTALFGVGSGMIGIYLATSFTTIGTTTPMLATIAATSSRSASMPSSTNTLSAPMTRNIHQTRGAVNMPGPS